MFVFEKVMQKIKIGKRTDEFSNHGFRKNGTRITALTLAFLLAFTSVDFGVTGAVRAEVLQDGDWEDIISVSHELVEEGTKAEIVVTEDNPNISITTVRMVRGKGSVIATASDAAMATVSDGKYWRVGTSSGAEEDAYRFLVEENGIYRFRISYRTEQDYEMVKKTITVDYEISDILDDASMEENLLLLTSDIHGEGKAEELELPIDRNVSGILYVNCNIPSNQKGRYIEIEFPKHIEVIAYPVTDPIDGENTQLTRKYVDGVQVSVLRLAILDSVSDNIQFQLNYKSLIKYEGDVSNGYLTADEMVAYSESEGLNFGSFKAKTFAGSGKPYAETELGPLTAKKNEATTDCLKMDFRYSDRSNQIEFTPAFAWTLPLSDSNNPTLWISNSGQRIRGNYTAPSHRAEGAVWSIDFPESISPAALKVLPISEGDSLLPDYKPEADIEKILLYLDNGTMVIAPLEKSDEDGLVRITAAVGTVIPQGRSIVKAEVYIKQLFNAKYYMVATGTVPNKKTDGTFFQEETGHIYSELSYGGTEPKRVSVMYKIKPFPCANMEMVLRSSVDESTLFQGDQGIYMTVNNLPSWHLTVNPKLEIEGELRNVMTGDIFVWNSIGSGWEIEYKTLFGNSGTYTINPAGNTGYYTSFASLSDGDMFTEVILKYDGTCQGSNSKMIDFYFKTTNEQRQRLPKDPNDPNYAYLTGSYSTSGDCPDHQEVPESNLSVRLPVKTSASLERSDMEVTVPDSVYQGETATVSLQPRFLLGFPDMPNRVGSLAFGNVDYYMEWLGGKELALINTDDGFYRYSFVKSADRSTTYLKISQKESGFKVLKPPYPSTIFDSTFPTLHENEIKIKLKVMPGTETWVRPVFGKIYADLKTYQEGLGEVERISNVRLTIKDALPDTNGICQDGDTVSPRLFLLSDGEKSVALKRNNVMGVNVMLGVDQIYEGSSLKFSSDQRTLLNADYSISSDQDRLLNYEVTFPIPKAGAEVTYQKEDKTQGTAVSEFNVSLRGPVAIGNGGNGVQVTYQLDGADVTEDQVGDQWDRVSAVRLYIAEFNRVGDTKLNLNVFMDLEAEEKAGNALLKAYMAPFYSFQSSAGIPSGQLYGGLATFSYGTCEISGVVWNDRNENGIRENGEPMMEDIRVQLKRGDDVLAETRTDAGGAYHLESSTSDGLSLKILVPGMPEATEDMVLTKSLAKGASEANNSDFVRPENGDLSYGTVDFAGNPMSSKVNVDAGLCYLPVLTVHDLQIKTQLSAPVQAQVAVQYGNLPAITYEDPLDTAIAIRNGTSIFAAGTQGDTTTAKVWVQNSLNDRVEKEYTIRILSNYAPVIVAHDWTLVEGDQVTDWWDSVQCYDPIDTPFVRLSIFDRIVKDRNVTFHREESAWEDSRIQGSEALSQPGTYYVRYSATDEDNNETFVVVKLTVYGKLEVRDPKSYHIVTEQEYIIQKDWMFYYREMANSPIMHVPGGQVQMNSDQPGFETPGIKVLNFSAAHPKEPELTTGGVMVGDGRRRQVEDTYYVDSNPIIFGTEDKVALPGDELELLNGVTGIYIHYGEHGPETNMAPVTVEDQNGNLIENGSYTAPEAGNYRLIYRAKVEEYYENGENTAETFSWLVVCGNVELYAPEVLYLTPEEAEDGAIVWEKLKPDVRGWYNDPETGAPVDLLESEITHDIVLDEAGKAVSVNIRGSHGVSGETILSEEVRTRVEVRNVPRVTVQDGNIRQGTAFDPRNGVGLAKEDPLGLNTWSVSGTADTDIVGKYELVYRADDPLTGAHTETTRQVYVHGKPELKVWDASLFTHQSTDLSQLMAAVHLGGGIAGRHAQASVRYVENDGTVTTEELTGIITYEEDPSTPYLPQTAGTYRINAMVDDSAVWAANGINGMEGMTEEKTAFVKVEEKVYQAVFTVNDPAKGGYGADRAEDYRFDVAHGKSLSDSMREPLAAEGYLFKAYKVQESFEAGSDLRLSDGSVVPSGGTVNAGTKIERDGFLGYQAVSDIKLQAVFEPKPAVTARDIKLYAGETYSEYQLAVQVEDKDHSAFTLTVNDSHVDTAIPGTYQVQIEVTNAYGNSAQYYAYVQVYGRTKIIDNAFAGVQTRIGKEMTRQELMDGIRAVYEKPADRPDIPWNLTENQVTAQTDITDMIMAELPDTDEIRKITVLMTAPGAISGREEAGSADGKRDVYIHGNPEISALDNAIYTHESTSDSVLEQVIRTGEGGRIQASPSVATVRYVQEDGSVETLLIPPSQISCRIRDYRPLTVGEYSVMLEVDDADLLPMARMRGLLPEHTTAEVRMTVADRIYTVTFLPGDFGSYKDGETVSVPVMHGNTVKAPGMEIVEGYELDYWQNQKGERIEDLAGYPVMEDIRLTPYFKTKTFQVRFIGRSNRVIRSEIVPYGSPATAPVDDMDVKSNNFTGWSRAFDRVTEDMDIYAQFDSQELDPTDPGIVEKGPEMDSVPPESMPFIPPDEIPLSRLPEEQMQEALPKTGEKNTRIKFFGVFVTMIAALAWSLQKRKKYK